MYVFMKVVALLIVTPINGTGIGLREAGGGVGCVRVRAKCWPLNSRGKLVLLRGG